MNLGTKYSKRSLLGQGLPTGARPHTTCGVTVTISSRWYTRPHQISKHFYTLLCILQCLSKLSQLPTCWSRGWRHILPQALLSSGSHWAYRRKPQAAAEGCGKPRAASGRGPSSGQQVRTTSNGQQSRGSKQRVPGRDLGSQGSI
jgi:hypothetical protein